MMKTKIIYGIWAACLLWACSKDDGGNEPPQAENNPPEAFDLIGVTDNAVSVDITPSFSWQAANDPDGDTVSYDLYLGTETEPSTLFAESITGTTFTVQERLSLITEYHWKVVAKDGKGGEAESTINNFTTRNLNIPNSPVTANASFSERYNHSVTVFDDKLWLIGGGHSPPYPKNDVWYSSDGANWTEATPTAGFSARMIHAMVSFDNKIWVMGGYDGNSKNDVWYSSDGVNWTEATLAAGFSSRGGHTVAVFDDKLWIIGGFGAPNGYKNDVWYSSDGVNWTEATSAAAFSARHEHATVVFDGKLWVIGGASANGYANDAWYSTDGANWAKATDAAFSPREGHTATVFENKMWVIGGIDQINGLKNDIWVSVDGEQWKMVPLQPDFPIRFNHAAAAFDEKLWVIAGIATNGGFSMNDVWAMD